MLIVYYLFLAILQEKMFAEQALAKERAAEMLQESEKKVAEQKQELNKTTTLLKEKENQVRNINIKSQKIAAATQKLEIAAATQKLEIAAATQKLEIDAATKLESEKIAADLEMNKAYIGSKASIHKAVDYLRRSDYTW